MIGDVLLLTDRHHRAGEAIVDWLLQNRAGRPKLTLAIGGESGSGKSELAHVVRIQLKKKAGIRSKVLHTDNYYRVPPADRTAWRQEHGVHCVGVDEYDWAAIGQHLQQFRDGAEAVLPFLDIVSEQEDRLLTSFAAIDVLVLEGLYSLHAAVDVKVFIDLTYHDTKKAQLLRGKEPQTVFRAQVLQREHEVVREFKAHADLIVTREFAVMAAG